MNWSSMQLQQDDLRIDITSLILAWKVLRTFISCSFNVKWPPRAYDFTQLDLFLRSNVRVHVSGDNTVMLNHFKTNICQLSRRNRQKCAQKLLKTICNLSFSGYLYNIVFLSCVVRNKHCQEIKVSKKS